MTNPEGEFNPKPVDHECDEIDWSANEFALPSDTRLLNPLTAEIIKRFEGELWSSVSIRDAVVCVTEAFNNAVKHGNKDKPNAKVSISFDLSNEELTIKVRDEGKGFSESEIPDPLEEENLLNENGRGVFLMKQHSAQAEFRQLDNGFEVTLHFINESGETI